MAKKLIRLFLFLLLPTLASAQGVPFSGNAQRTIQNFLAPIPGALITFCTSAGTGMPCTPTAPIYSDASLTQLITGSAITADSNGNWIAYAPPGNYKYSITATGVTGQLFSTALPVTLASNNTLTGSNTFSQQIVSTVATGTAPLSVASTTQVANLNASQLAGQSAPASAIVGISDTQTLTNKSIDCTANTLSKSPCVVYSTASASTNASISATTMATAGGSGNTYRFSAYTDQTVLGTSCTSNTSVAAQIIFTDPNTSSTTTATYTTMTIINNGTVGNTNSVFNNSSNPAGQHRQSSFQGQRRSEQAREEVAAFHWARL